ERYGYSKIQRDFYPNSRDSQARESICKQRIDRIGGKELLLQSTGRTPGKNHKKRRSASKEPNSMGKILLKKRWIYSFPTTWPSPDNRKRTNSKTRQCESGEPSSRRTQFLST